MKHNRRSIRLKEYDYSTPGAYFITICAHNRACLFGDIKDGVMVLNEYGGIVRFTWDDLPNHIRNIELDKFIVMPNHFHGIINIVSLDANDVGAGSEPAPTIKHYALSEMIRQLKTFSAKRINELRRDIGVCVWQRNYYEHVIRDENELTRVREYIAGNPLEWDSDEYNPMYASAVGAGSKPALFMKGANQCS